MKYMANIITGFRILCSFLMLFFPAFSVRFYCMYILGGINDMVDGTIARKTNSSNEFGAKLDTVADFIFMIISFIKLFPMLNVPRWLLIWIVIISMIRIHNIILGFIHKKTFIEIHTLPNKITGLLLFLLPLTLNFIKLKYSSVLVCFVASFSSIQEYFIIRTKP